jgi:hypothetical protein
MEGPHRWDVGAKHGVPAHQGHKRLVDMDDVVAVAAQLASRGTNTARRKRREVGDCAVRRNADRATERKQVVRCLAKLRLGPVQPAAEPPWWVEGRKHTDVMATTEELLGERLNVPVYAALVGPGIWRDERDSHELERVVDCSAANRARHCGRSVHATATNASR